ncbi:MAG: hypothetical protein HY240_05040 [Actinobacteria bacterium]|nr:hypothetical protein [Actinomycetota bacterium]
MAMIGAYRPTISGSAHALQVYLTSAAPARGEAVIQIQVGVSTKPDADFCFLLQRVGDPDEAFLEVRLSDVYPEILQSVRRRLSLWVEELVGKALVRVQEMARGFLREQGYPTPDE